MAMRNRPYNKHTPLASRHKSVRVIYINTNMPSLLMRQHCRHHNQCLGHCHESQQQCCHKLRHKRLPGVVPSGVLLHGTAGVALQEGHSQRGQGGWLHELKHVQLAQPPAAQLCEQAHWPPKNPQHPLMHPRNLWFAKGLALGVLSGCVWLGILPSQPRTAGSQQPACSHEEHQILSTAEGTALVAQFWDRKEHPIMQQVWAHVCFT